MGRGKTRMSKVRESIRLNEQAGMSCRVIGQVLNVSKTTVNKYLQWYRASGLTYAQIVVMADDELQDSVEGVSRAEKPREEKLAVYFCEHARELSKTGVTRKLLWEEYRCGHPDGYLYTQFCYHLREWQKAEDLRMPGEHKVGDKMYVDFSGKKLTVTDRISGEKRDVEFFVALLGASQLAYAEVRESQKKADWIAANENALRYFGGSPAAIVPDCLRSAVSNPDKYEPEINPDYADFARHYSTVILPARPRRPLDKPLAEKLVDILYTRVFAPLRNEIFYSCEELNVRIRELVEKHNCTKFQRINTTRRALFEEIERCALKPLPAERYEMKQFKRLKVQFNYHVYWSAEGRYYSVPCQYRRKEVVVIATHRVIEIYYNNIRIASHSRRLSHGYSTLPEHMPSTHKFVSEWNPDRFIRWGKDIGEHVEQVIMRIFEKKAHPEQAYKVCMGILSLVKAYGKERVNAACKKALQYEHYSYKWIKHMLSCGMERDESDIESALNPMLALLPEHDNIRGSAYYKGE